MFLLPQVDTLLHSDFADKIRIVECCTASTARITDKVSADSPLGQVQFVGVRGTPIDLRLIMGAVAVDTVHVGGPSGTGAAVGDGIAMTLGADRVGDGAKVRQGVGLGW